MNIVGWEIHMIMKFMQVCVQYLVGGTKYTCDEQMQKALSFKHKIH